MDNAMTARTGAASTIALCFVVAFLEGFDLQSTGVAAPHIAHEFGLSTAQMGWAFSLGTIGMLPGGALGGRLADRLGRKRVLTAAVAVFGIFSLATTQIWDFHSLLIARLMTGLGLGGAMPNLVALCSEAADARMRNTAVGLMYGGLPLGSAAAAAIAIISTGDHSWQHIYYVGGLGPLFILPLLGFCLAESASFIANRQHATQRRCAPYAEALWRDGRTLTTLSLWTSYVSTLVVLFFLLNWLPSLVVGLGLSGAQAAEVQFLFNIGGGIGAALIGTLMDRAGRKRTVIGMYLGIAVGLLILSMANGFVSMVCGGMLAGLFLAGGQSVLYALASTLYPTHVRGTGIGATVAVGRLGSFLGPMAAGQLIAAGMGSAGLMVASIPVTLFAALGALWLVATGRAAD